MYFNQQTIIGFLGAAPEIKHLPNGTPVVRLTVATKKSWKDPQSGDWKDRTQWHHVVAYGEHFERVAARLTTGSHVFVQGEMTTRIYDKIIEIPNGQKPRQHTIRALAVELKADTVRLLDHAATDPEANDAAEPLPEEVPQ
jgi:single stranded DNA-binding protein